MGWPYKDSIDKELPILEGLSHHYECLPCFPFPKQNETMIPRAQAVRYIQAKNIVER
jgi:hypothetical protein